MIDSPAPEPVVQANSYDRAPCGLITMTRSGEIVRANQTFRRWIGMDGTQPSVRFFDVLGVGDRIFWQTHVGPLLDLQGEVHEIAVELSSVDGSPLPSLINARILEPSQPGALIDVAIFPAKDRRSYEQELLWARQRAELSEEQARVLATTLQRSLLPPSLPTVPGLDLGAAYRPAGEGAEVGGDFYDIFQLTTDEWLIAVGDVCGKGPEAAALTALARYTIRGAAMETDDLAEVFNAVNTTLLHDRSDRTCTAVVGRVSPTSAGHEVRVCTAGHPLPRLVAATGDVVRVGSSGMLLGAYERAEQEEDRVHLEEGDALVFFTDGVTEARRGHDFFGEERLHTLLESAAKLPASGIARVVADAAVAFQDGNPRDDVAVFVVRQLPVG